MIRTVSRLCRFIEEPYGDRLGAIREVTANAASQVDLGIVDAQREGGGSVLGLPRLSPLPERILR